MKTLIHQAPALKGSRRVKASKERMSLSFSFISLSRSAIALLDNMMRTLVRIFEEYLWFRSRLSPTLHSYLPAGSPGPGAEFRHLRLQLVDVLVENGSTLLGAQEKEEALPVHWADNKDMDMNHRHMDQKCGCDCSSQASIWVNLRGGSQRWSLLKFAMSFQEAGQKRGYS